MSGGERPDRPNSVWLESGSRMDSQRDATLPTEVDVAVIGAGMTGMPCPPPCSKTPRD